MSKSLIAPRPLPLRLSMGRVIVDEAPEVGLDADDEDSLGAQDCALMSPSKMDTLGKRGSTGRRREVPVGVIW